MVIKGISFSSMPALPRFERALTNTITTRTQTITAIETTATIEVLLVFIGEVLALIIVVVVVIDNIEAIASFIEEAMVFVVVVVFVDWVEVAASLLLVFVVAMIAVVVEVNVHAVNDIDPEEFVNMPSFFALE